MPACSIVIRSYNEEKHIGRLLSGILQQDLAQVEIVLVDSGSTDATLAIASRFPVRILPMSPEDFTFGRSLNRGCSQASGDYIVIASAHIYPVYPDWLEQLLAPFNDPQVAVVYGKQRGNETASFSEQQIFAAWFPDQSNLYQEHPFCNNANAAIRRALWEQRPYDESLPGLEDLEWASWAIQQGYRVAYSAEAEVIHVHEESYRQIYNRYRREGMGLKLIRPQEEFRFWDFARLFVSNVFSDLWHARSQGLLAKVLWSVPTFRLMQFWGTFRGFKQAGPLTSELKRTFYYPRGRRARGRPSSRRPKAIDYRSIGSMADLREKERGQKRRIGGN